MAERRLGRPPSADGSATRHRLLDAARRRFATAGYGPTTNRDVAADVGITTGAIYHYVDSKAELYLAVHREVDQVVFGAFAKAVAGVDGFVAQLRAVLDTAVRLNGQDPTIAAFTVGVASEAARHPELAPARSSQAREAARFFAGIVAEGRATGELSSAVDDQDVVHLLTALTLGLADFSVQKGDTEVHGRVADLLVELFDGTLVTPAGRAAPTP